MNDEYLNKITNADAREHLPLLEDDRIDLFLSDIPYGIGLNDWDVLHNNTNSAYLGSSPAQKGKSNGAVAVQQNVFIRFGNLGGRIEFYRMYFSNGL